MRVFLAVLISLVVIAFLWRLLSWVIGMAMGLLYVALLCAAILFIVGLVRRLLRT